MMSANIPKPMTSLRVPQLRILADGKPIPGAIEASWTETNSYSADTWHASFATGYDPHYGPDWWDRRDDPLVLEIQVGFGGDKDGTRWTGLRGVGQVDSHTICPERGTIEVEGRDLSALMIEQPTAELFQNQTASEIVKTIAARHSLKADVTDTAELVSRYMPGDHTHGSQAQHGQATNEWELLVNLARAEGYDLFMDRYTLNFHPVPDPMKADPYVIRYTAGAGASASPVCNAIDLRMTRRFAVAKATVVVVKSFSSRTGRTVTSTQTRGGTTGGGTVSGAVYLKPGKGAKRYVFVRPNLTQQQADEMAKAMLDDITRHERTINWREPGMPHPHAGAIIRVEGTGTDFDALYHCDRVTRTISIDRGFTMDVSAKNHSKAIDGATSD